MLDLSATEFYLAVPNVPEADLKHLSTSLFDLWEEYVDSSLSLQDYSLFLQVEEGSVRGRVEVWRESKKKSKHTRVLKF